MSRTPSVNRTKRIINPGRNLDALSAKKVALATYPWLRFFAPKDQSLFEYWLMETCETIEVFTLSNKRIAKLKREREHVKKFSQSMAFRDTVYYSKRLFIFYGFDGESSFGQCDDNPHQPTAKESDLTDKLTLFVSNASKKPKCTICAVVVLLKLDWRSDSHRSRLLVYVPTQQQPLTPERLLQLTVQGVTDVN